MTIEFAAALAIGTFLVVVILIWKKLRFIDARLREMQNEINELHTVESRLFMMALNVKHDPKTDPSVLTEDGGSVDDE
jgi:hypothetical protein